MARPPHDPLEMLFIFRVRSPLLHEHRQFVIGPSLMFALELSLYAVHVGVFGACCVLRSRSKPILFHARGIFTCMHLMSTITRGKARSRNKLGQKAPSRGTACMCKRRVRVQKEAQAPSQRKRNVKSNLSDVLESVEVPRNEPLHFPKKNRPKKTTRRKMIQQRSR